MKKQLKTKNYTEDVETLAWLTANVPKQQESMFIRNAVREKIDRIEKKNKKSIEKIHKVLDEIQGK